MTDSEIIDRLSYIWAIYRNDGIIPRAEAAAFLALYREMQSIDRENAEQERVEHAREISNPRR